MQFDIQYYYGLVEPKNKHSIEKNTVGIYVKGAVIISGQ